MSDFADFGDFGFGERMWGERPESGPGPAPSTRPSEGNSLGRLDWPNEREFNVGRKSDPRRGGGLGQAFSRRRRQ